MLYPMKLRTIYFALFISISHCALSQNKTFQQFAGAQDSLMRKAYDDRSVNNYLMEFSKFERTFNSLSDDDKKYFRGYKFSALYNLCCIYSLLNDKKNAITCLEKSIQAGWNDYEHITADSDLNNIRNEVAFQKVIQPLRETGDYLYILKKAARYNLNEGKQNIPVFNYQAADNPNLVALRKTFNLDSIAGSAGEIVKILNLMRWVHNLVPHDGNHENPVIKNAMSMIKECRSNARGLNCRGLATVLNECYLAIGISSRFVTCMPKDSLGIDPDCHVINSVYSNELKKWIWIDPTNNAYVMNEKGELLSIEEVRQRLITDQPLILNQDANWNNKLAVTKQNYLYHYMAKNLYMLESPLNSQFDSETSESEKTINYIRLIPLDYFKKSLNKNISTNNVTKTTLVTYRTNNPALFWQVPQ